MLNALQVAAAVATIIAAVVAVATLLYTWGQAQEATRPSVVVDLVPNPVNSLEAELVVRNYGRTAARNLKISFSPPLRTGPDAPKQSLGDVVVQRYEGATIASLAPGRTLSNIYWQTGDAKENTLGLPSATLATAHYEGRQGSRFRRAAKYTDTFSLDMAVIKGGTQSVRTTKGKELDRIAVATEAIARQGR